MGKRKRSLLLADVPIDLLRLVLAFLCDGSCATFAVCCTKSQQAAAQQPFRYGSSMALLVSLTDVWGVKCYDGNGSLRISRGQRTLQQDILNRVDAATRQQLVGSVLVESSCHFTTEQPMVQVVCRRNFTVHVAVQTNFTCRCSAPNVFYFRHVFSLRPRGGADNFVEVSRKEYQCWGCCPHGREHIQEIKARKNVRRAIGQYLLNQMPEIMRDCVRAVNSSCARMHT